MRFPAIFVCHIFSVFNPWSYYNPPLSFLCLLPWRHSVNINMSILYPGKHVKHLPKPICIIRYFCAANNQESPCCWAFLFILICILAKCGILQNYANPLILYSHCYLIKQVKGLSKEELVIRDDLVLGLAERIQVIPDGIATAAKQAGGWTASASHKNIKFDSSGEAVLLLFLLEIEFKWMWAFQLIVNACLFHYEPQMDTLTMIFSIKLKNQANLDKNMKCAKWNRHVRFLINVFMPISYN